MSAVCSRRAIAAFMVCRRRADTPFDYFEIAQRAHRDAHADGPPSDVMTPAVILRFDDKPDLYCRRRHALYAYATAARAGERGRAQCHSRS